MNGGRASAVARPPTARRKPKRKPLAARSSHSHEFGYRRITIERPLRLSVQFSDERLAELRFATGALNAVMQKSTSSMVRIGRGASYGKLGEVATEVRALIKADFTDLKEKHVKDLLAAKTWNAQKELLDKAEQLQAVIGTAQTDDFNAFEDTLKKALARPGSSSMRRRRSSYSMPSAGPTLRPSR